MLINWSTESRKVVELKEWVINPRTISNEKLDELVTSIDELGNFEPLVINTDGTVIAGNQRLEVARRLGIEDVEVSVPDRKLTDEEVKRIGLLSNKHSGDWDLELLAQEFEDTASELGFMDLLVASEEDIESLWNGMPEYKQEHDLPYKLLYVRFDNQSDVDEFSRLIGQNITENTKSIWYPFKEDIDLKAYKVKTGNE